MAWGHRDTEREERGKNDEDGREESTPVFEVFFFLFFFPFFFLGLFASCLVAATVVCFVCQDYVWRR